MSTAYALGPFRLDTQSKLLWGGTEPVALGRRAIALLKLLIGARRFHATLVGSDGMLFAVLGERQGVSPSDFTRLVRLSYLAR